MSNETSRCPHGNPTTRQCLVCTLGDQQALEVRLSALAARWRQLAYDLRSSKLLPRDAAKANADARDMCAGELLDLLGPMAHESSSEPAT